MRPNETFSFVNHNQVHQDVTSLGRFYLPLIGHKGLALYTYLLAVQDNGAEQHPFSDILNHVNLAMPDFEEQLSVLIAVKLVQFAQLDDGTYKIWLNSAMDAEHFFQHQVLTNLLVSRLGEGAVKRLKPEGLAGAKVLDQKLSDVFSGVADSQAPLQTVADNDFDLQHFKQLMARDNLRFSDEQADIMGLFNYAELAQKSWFETYQMAKETAVGQVISTKRLLKTLEQPPAVTEEFSTGEQSLIRWAKSRQPLAFLADVKQSRQASITSSERQVLKDLAQLGLLDPVINVLVLYTFNKVNSANLNEKYALKLGNELSYKKVNSAEAAVLFLREPRAQEQGKRGTTTKSSVSNVPEWSKESYRTEATPEELEELEALRRRMLGDKEA